jgi:trans-aconitate methyltransferase
VFGASFAYVGIDLSDVAIDQAREPGLACSEFLVANATNFEPPHPFDVIVFNEILYYLEDPAEQVRRYAQYLAPAGIFVVSMYYSPASFRTWKRLNAELKTLDHVTVSHRSSRLRFDVAVMTPL